MALTRHQAAEQLTRDAHRLPAHTSGSQPQRQVARPGRSVQAMDFLLEEQAQAMRLGYRLTAQTDHDECLATARLEPITKHSRQVLATQHATAIVATCRYLDPADALAAMTGAVREAIKLARAAEA